MPNVLTASALALLSLAGTVLGVQLGQSTIAQINPAYFGSPRSGHLYAELTPVAYRAPSSAEPVPEPWSAETTGYDPPCSDCPAVSQVERYPDPVARSDDTWQPSEPLPQVIRGIPRGELEQYMNFPVTQQEARKQQQEGPPRYARRDGTEEPDPDVEPQPDGL